MAKVSALRSITAAAKKIRKASPGTSWKTAVKKAGALYRAKKKKVFHKRGAKVGAPLYVAKKVANKIVISKPKKVGSVRGGGIPGGKEMRISSLYDELKRLENMRMALKAKKREVKLKSQKAQIEKVIAYYNRQVNHVKKNIELLRRLV